MIRTGIAATVDMDNPDEVARIYQRVISWGVPHREIKVVMNGLREEPSLRYAREWIAAAHGDDGPNLLVLAGPKGVGKTIAAVWGMFHADPALPFGAKWKSEQAPRFRHVSELAETGLYGEDKEKRERYEVKHTKCLVIDDVGVENLTEPFLALFDSVVNARYGSMGLTILTTNLTAEKFSLRYGARVYDRIKGRGDWYDIDHESMRGRDR